ncbi:MAG TPA: HIT family protein [Candidatus Dormibacteraeota bacterium]|nr:HIT family protein [Candidatus Dormibacteraeota bacterium]
MDWPPDFYLMREGRGCPMCGGGRPDETPFGVRIFAGKRSDAYLQRSAIQRGYSLVIWRGHHVAEPTQLTPDEAAGYWLEVLRVARAIEQELKPVKMNFNILGNSVPHLHTHVIPRYAIDPKPTHPFPFPPDDPPPFEKAGFRTDVALLRQALGWSGSVS